MMTITDEHGKNWGQVRGMLSSRFNCFNDENSFCQNLYFGLMRLLGVGGHLIFRPCHFKNGGARLSFEGSEPIFDIF